MVGNFSIEGILLRSIGGFQLLHLLSVDVSQPSDFFKQMSDLAVLEGDLSVEDFRLVIFGLHGRMEIIQFSLGVIFNLLHGGSVVLKCLIAFRFHANDLLAEHAHTVFLIGCHLLHLPLQGAVLMVEDIELLLQVVDLLPQSIHQGAMGQSRLLPFGIGRLQVVLILCLQSLDGLVELQFTLTLDSEDLVLQLRHQIPQGSL